MFAVGCGKADLGVLIVYYGWYHGSGYNCHVYSSGSVIYKLASCVIDVLLYYYYMYMYYPL